MKYVLEKFALVERFGSFDRPLRNIRAYLDEMTLIVELIPCAIPWTESSPFCDVTEVRFIVEGERALRLTFENISGWMVHEEFVPHISFDDEAASHASPTVRSGKGIWPLLIALDSPWKASLPDYQGGRKQDLLHYRIYSMTTYHDILAELSSGEWIKNDRAAETLIGAAQK